MTRSTLFTAALVPVLVFGLPHFAQAQTSPSAPTNVPSQIVQMPSLDLDTGGPNFELAQMQQACEGRARFDAMPNAAELKELEKILNLPSRAECARFNGQQRQASRPAAPTAMAGNSRTAPAPVTDAPAAPPQAAPVFVPVAPQLGGADEMAPMPLNP
jgi:hypothetical protein